MGIINLYKKGKLYRLIQKGINDPTLFVYKEYWIEVIKLLIEIKEFTIVIKKGINMLAGYKTYIIAVLSAALVVVHTLGYIDEATYQNLLALLAAGGLSTVAAKINRINSTK